MNSTAGFLVFLLLLLVALAGFLFRLNNEGAATLWLGRDVAPLSLGIWVLGAFLVGGATGLLGGYGLWNKLQVRRQINSLRKQLQKEQADNRQLQEQVASLEAKPGNPDRD